MWLRTGVTDGATLFRVEGPRRHLVNLVEKRHGLNHPANTTTSFVFEGALYRWGAGIGNQDLLISRLEDNGATWTKPTDATNGVLLTGGFTGRRARGGLRRASLAGLRTAGSNTSIKRPFVISAPVDADLLDASSWTKIRQPHYRQRNDRQQRKRPLPRLIEGQHGRHLQRPLQHPRASSKQTSQLAAKVTVTSPSKLTFSVSNDFITFPGGGRNSRSVRLSRAAATGPSPILRPRNTSE